MAPHAIGFFCASQDSGLGGSSRDRPEGRAGNPGCHLLFAPPRRRDRC